MTVGTENSYALLAWTGVETSFSPGFAANDPTYVNVSFLSPAGVLTPLTRGVHFSVTLSAGTTGVATVTPIALPTAPGTLYITRDTPATQFVDFTNLGKFDAFTHTFLHDAAAMRAGELKRDRSRTLLMPLGEAGLTFPPLAALKGNVLGFDPVTGAPVPLSPLLGLGNVIGPVGAVADQIAVFDGDGNHIKGAASVRIVTTGLVVLQPDSAGADHGCALYLDRLYGAVGDSQEIVWGSGGTGINAGNRIAAVKAVATAAGEGALDFCVQTGGGDGYGNRVLRLAGTGLATVSGRLSIEPPEGVTFPLGAPAGRRLTITDGTTGTPVTTDTPTLIVTRIQDRSGISVWQDTILAVATGLGNAQVNALRGVAYALGSNDAQGVGGEAESRVNGKGAFGGFFIARAAVPGATAVAVQTQTENLTGSSQPFDAAVLANNRAIGFDVNAYAGGAANILSAGILIRADPTTKWDKGIATLAGDHVNTFFADYSNSTRAFHIAGGTHLHAIDTSGGVFTGADIKLSNNGYLGWRNAANSADIGVLLLDASDNIRVGGVSFAGVVSMGGHAVGRATSTYDLGTTAIRWRAGYVDTLTLTNALTPANGGTGQSSYAIGDLLYASGAAALSKLADVATGNVLLSGGVTTAPAWGKVTSSHLSGTANRLLGLDGSGNGANITLPAAGLTLSGGALALANDLSAIEALSTTGLARRTGTDAWSLGTTVSIAEGGTGQITAAAAFDALSPNTTRGDLTVRGVSSNVRLAVGAANRVLRSDGTDPNWGQLTSAYLTGTADRLLGFDGSGNGANITLPAAGLTLSGGAIALANDLSAIEALATTGIPKRTGTDAWSLVTAPTGTIVGTSDSQTLSGKTFSGATNFPGSTVIDASGNIGIGITPSSTALHLLNNSGYGFKFERTAATTQTFGIAISGSDQGLTIDEVAPSASQRMKLMSVANGGHVIFTGDIWIGGNKVVGPRSTGWTAQTAGSSKADLGAAPTVGAIASWARAMQDALTTHGLLGA